MDYGNSRIKLMLYFNHYAFFDLFQKKISFQVNVLRFGVLHSISAGKIFFHRYKTKRFK